MRGINLKDFHRPDPVPEDAIQHALEVMRSGEMFRYSGDSALSDTLLLEQEFAAYVGTKYALGVNSCSSAILLALMACGVKRGDKVLMPAFTFTAVPSAIVHAGAEIIPVECNNNYRVDINDFRTKAVSSGAKVFLLSYMRGHISDLDAIQTICREHDIMIIEDAAHALGNRWRGKLLGGFGRAACFSFQSNKIINAGEGGMLVTNDPEIIVQAIYLSGAYERLPHKHGLSPDHAEHLIKHQDQLALFNMRASNLMSAIVRPQLRTLEEKIKIYQKHYQYLVARLAASEQIEVPKEDEREVRIPDSIQFRVRGLSTNQISTFWEHVKKSGLPFAAFGADKNNARAFWNWGYAKNLPPLPLTRESLMNTFDMRLSYALTERHLDYLTDIVLDALATTKA
ncbi:MAG: DegT/DnrJ/EryC1/StrS family aminotransferase [Minisyncoccota bacterium]